jgi:hypothetical protein
MAIGVKSEMKSKIENVNVLIMKMAANDENERNNQ